MAFSKAYGTAKIKHCDAAICLLLRVRKHCDNDAYSDVRELFGWA